MKCFISIFFVALLCHTATEAQTQTNIAVPENVLVVYS